MTVVCLDLEGVLVPEIWIAFSQKTGIKELELTTRDIPDYRELMNRRIKILKEHNLSLKDIQQVISTMKPLNGAKEFIEELRTLAGVIILSDTFEEFASPLMRQIGSPTLFCNNLIVDEAGMITDFQLRINDGKKRAIEALRSINLKTIAAGDSYNDLSMIKTADHGFFFRPPQRITEENPEIPVVTEHAELLKKIRHIL